MRENLVTTQLLASTSDQLLSVIAVCHEERATSSVDPREQSAYLSPPHLFMHSNIHVVAGQVYVFQSPNQPGKIEKKPKREYEAVFRILAVLGYSYHHICIHF
jgi:hypothetical protein